MGQVVFSKRLICDGSQKNSKYEIRQWTRAIDQIGDVKTSHSTM
jgi:hypothetical protein